MLDRSANLFLVVSTRGVGVLWCAVSGGGLSVRRAAVEAYPEGLDASDSRELGRWLAATLERLGVGASSAVVVLERKDVASKRLSFEGVADPEAELPGMVRLQMLRQLSFPADSAAIDYVELPGEGDGSSDETVVRAVAAPGERIEHLRAALGEAGLKVSRMALSAEGVCQALVGRGVVEVGESVLVVSPAMDGMELSIVRGGRVATARWQALSPTADTSQASAFFDLAIAAEVRRTWMSDQLSEGPGGGGRVVLIGGGADGGTEADDAARRLADAIAEDLGLPAGVVSPSRLLGEGSSGGAGGGAGGASIDQRLVSLVGVAWEESDRSSRSSRIDVLHPRRAPDRAAPVRQMAMLAVLVLLVVVGGVWSLGNVETAKLERELEAVRERRNTVVVERAEAVQRAARAEHVLRHLAGTAAPLETLDEFTALMPERERALVTGFAYEVASEVAFDASGRLRFYDGERWRSNTLVRVDLDVKASSRAEADAVRETFVKRDDLYVQTSGVDGATTRDPTYPALLALEMQRREVGAIAEVDELIGSRRAGAGEGVGHEDGDGDGDALAADADVAGAPEDVDVEAGERTATAESNGTDGSGADATVTVSVDADGGDGGEVVGADGGGAPASSDGEAAR